MGKGKGKQSRARAFAEEIDESPTDNRFGPFSQGYEEEDVPQPPTFQKRNLFSDLIARFPDEVTEESDPSTPPAEVFAPFPSHSLTQEESKADDSPHQTVSVTANPINDRDISHLQGLVKSLQATLTAKKSQMKDLMMQLDSYKGANKDKEMLHEELVQAYVRIDTLEDKLTRRKEKYKSRLEEAEKFLAEREQIKKAEIFAVHLQKEFKAKCERIEPTLKKNEELAQEISRLKAAMMENDKNVRLMKQKMAHEWKEEVEKLQAKLSLKKTKNRYLAQENKKLTSLVEETSLKFESNKKTIADLENQNRALQRRISAAEKRSPDELQRLSIEEAQDLLADLLESANRLNRVIRVKTEGEALGSKCVVCLANPRNVLIQPCSHMIVCQECAPKVGKCPVCRQDITGRIRVLGN